MRTVPPSDAVVRELLGPDNADVHVLAYDAGPEHPVWRKWCVSAWCPRLTRHPATMATALILPVDIPCDPWVVDIVREVLASLPDDVAHHETELLATATAHCEDALLAEVREARHTVGTSAVIVEVPVMRRG